MNPQRCHVCGDGAYVYAVLSIEDYFANPGPPVYRAICDSADCESPWAEAPTPRGALRLFKIKAFAWENRKRAAKRRTSEV